MDKRVRQYIGLITAVVAYYVIHEGAHLLYALATNTFKQINFMGMGVQIDVYAQNLSQTQLGIFCLVGSVATLIAAGVLLACMPWICRASSKVFKACAYYTTLAVLLLDPLYLSLLCGFFGGGDMNGIGLLVPEVAARVIYGVILAVNLLLILKVVLPKYKEAFAQ